MKPESLRIRVLDVLEEGPMTVAMVSARVGSNVTVTRMMINTLIDDMQVEQVDKCHRDSTGGPRKVYAIRGSVPNCQALNVREEQP